MYPKMYIHFALYAQSASCPSVLYSIVFSGNASTEQCLLLAVVCTWWRIKIALDHSVQVHGNLQLKLLTELMMTSISAKCCLHRTCSGLASSATYELQLVGLLHQAVLDYRDTPGEGAQTISGPIATEVAGVGGLYVADVRWVFRISCRVQGAALTRWAYAAQGATVSCGAWC